MIIVLSFALAGGDRVGEQGGGTVPAWVAALVAGSRVYYFKEWEGGIEWSKHSQLSRRS